jgi:hypothetical protein
VREFSTLRWRSSPPLWHRWQDHQRRSAP